MDPQNYQSLKTRDQALVMISLLLEREGTTALLGLLDPERRDEILSASTTLLAMPGRARFNLALTRLKHLLDPDNFEPIDEIHPQWIADYLERQPPLPAGLMLKSMPVDFIARIFAEIEPRTATNIQNRLRGIAPPPHLKTLLQAILNRRFQLPNPLSGAGRDPFEAIFFLNCAELAALVEELGSAELAMACQNLPSRDFDTICRKLTPRIKEKIKIKLAQYAQTPLDRIVRARQSFLLMQDELYEKGKLIEFTGIHILAAVMGGIPVNRLQFLAHKLPRRDGEIFLKLAQRLATTPKGEDRGVTRPEIVAKIIYLAEIDHIRSLWKYI